MKIDKNKHMVIYIYLIAVLHFLLLSCKEDIIVTPPTDKDSITVVDSNKAILAYFPLNIGDIKYYNRIENEGWVAVSYSQFVNICISDTILENGLTYYKNKIQFFYSDSTQNMVGESYYRIDTSTQIIYEYIRHKNKEEVFLPLNLKVGESFSLSDEENIVLSSFDTISVFNKQMGRKVFERRDIYGYTYHRYELLENIGLYNYLYRGDIIGSMEDSLRGAIINGENIGDISDPSFPEDSTITRCDSLHSTFPNYTFVPCDYSSIQSAIDASGNGDVIVVEEGEYKEEIDFNGKNITVASFFFIDGDTSHISKTKIVGDDASNGKWSVSFTNGETSNAVLIGFTIDCSRADKFRDGGGIRCISSNPHLKNLIVSNNMMADNDGSGIYLENSSALLENLIIKKNKTQNYGGGIYLIESDVTISNTIFSENVSYFRGGAIYLINSNAIINNSTFTSNRSDYDGGGIYCEKSNPQIYDSKFISNFSANGSPAIFSENSNLKLTDLNITNSSGSFSASTEESAVTAIGSNIIAENISIVENKSSGISLDSTKLTIRNSFITKNIVGIKAFDGSLLNMENVTISNNKGYVYSSGMVISNSEFTIDNLKCVNNGPADGGIGGIGIFESNGNINNSVVSENFCGGHGEGGGGFFIKSSNVDLKYVLISDNSAFDLNGSAIYSDGADISLKNVTLVNNSENLVNGGSIYNINNSSISIINSILWNNTPRNFYDTLGVTISYSDVEGGFAGEGNINVDPLFCSPVEKKYNLKPTSPCIGAGENGETIGSEKVGCN